MSGLCSTFRPVTRREMAIAFDLKTSQLDSLLERHAIDPACRIAGVRVYGPEQVRAALVALTAERRVAHA